MRAAKDASNKRATDYLRAVARSGRRVEGLGEIARNVQRAIDVANEELLVRGLNGYEAQCVLMAILNKLWTPDYPME